jgi:hypothetical protein
MNLIIDVNLEMRRRKAKPFFVSFMQFPIVSISGQLMTDLKEGYAMHVLSELGV